MKYGAVQSVEGLDLSLPGDHEINTLNRNSPQGELQIYVGGTQWTQPQWKGKWYPPKLPQRKFLEAYGELFNTIEGNATHYRIYDRERIEAWANRLPDDFRFCPKIPQTISHYRRLNNVEEPTRWFLDGIMGFGDKLGPSFIQMPANFTTKHSDRLLAYLSEWPREFRLAVEVRHESWFGSREMEELIALCYNRGIGMVITDTPGRRDALHMARTSDFLILRFGGHGMHKTDYERMEEWVDRIGEWHSDGLNAVYMFMHQPQGLLAPEGVAYFGEILSKRFHYNFRYTASPPY